jgi:hypothetical protein
VLSEPTQVGLTGKVEYELVNAYEKFTKFTKFTKGTKGPQGCVTPAGGAAVCDTQNARPLYRSLEPWHVHVEGPRTHTGPNPGCRNAVLLFESARPTVSDLWHINALKSCVILSSIQRRLVGGATKQEC